MKKVLAMILVLVMVLAMIPAAVAVNSDYKAGLIVEKPSLQNLNGPYGDAYAAAGYQATFTYVEENGADVENVQLVGYFQWSTRDDVKYWEDNGYTGNINTLLSAYDYTADLVQVGFGYPKAEPGGRGDGANIRYDMTEVEAGIWQITIPVPAGEYRYDYIVTDSEGASKQIKDPAEDVDWYVINTQLAEEKWEYWSYFKVGTATDDSQGQNYIYDLEDESLRGSVSKATVTAVNGNPENIQIYTPYNFDANSEEPYKVIFLCHGSTENETTWMTLGAVPEIMNNLIYNGILTDHVLAVTMDNDLPYNNYGDRDAVIQTITDVIVPYLIENYNLSANPMDYAICGGSAGGRTSGQALSDYTTKFGGYGLFNVAGGANLTNMTEENYEALKNVAVYCASGSLDSRQNNNTLRAYNQAVQYGAAKAEFKLFDGAHDFITWHQTFIGFARFLDWGTYSYGLTVEDPTEENLNGEFGDAYKAAGHQATFTYIEEPDEDIDHIEVWGDFQWFAPEEVEQYVADFANYKMTASSAYQLGEDYVVAGYGSPIQAVDASENAYGVSGVYSAGGFMYYPLEETSEGVWQLTMPIPAGQYRYAYKLYHTDGTIEQVKDPNPDVDWYVIETMNPNPAYWSYFLVGTADEAGQGQSII